MNDQRAIRWIDRFALPRYRLFRAFVRWGLVLFGLAAPFAFIALLSGDVFVQRSNGPVRAIAGAMPFSQTEQRFAENLVRDQLIYSANFPIWDAPSAGFFAVPAGDPARIPLEAAMVAIRQIEQEIKPGGNPPDEVVLQQIEAAQQSLGAVGQDEGRDRAVVLYHRALLNVRTEDYGAAINDLGKLFERIDQDLPRFGRSHATNMRVAGVRIAAHYLRGYAHVRVDPSSTGRSAAEEDYRQALEIAASLSRGRNTEASPFIQLNAETHLVSMSTTSIWNDLIKVISSSGRDGIDRAVREASSLIQSPSYLSSDPALAANLMLLVAVDPSRATLVSRSNKVAAMGRAVDRAEGANADQARQRADIARVLTGLTVVQREQGPDRQTPVRGAFRQIVPGSGPGEGSAYFPTVDVAGAPDFAAQLDGWLFIREWRRRLGEGDLAGFQRSFNALREGDDVQMELFNGWRDESMEVVRQRLEEKADGLALGQEERRDVYAALVNSDLFYSPLGRFRAMVDYALGGWWWLWLIGTLLLYVMVVVLLYVLELYRRTFEPHHHQDRLVREPTPRERGDQRNASR